MTYDYAHHLVQARLRSAHLRDVAAAAAHLHGLNAASMEAYLAHVAVRNTLRYAFRAGCGLADVALASGIPAREVAAAGRLAYAPPVDTESEGAYLVGSAS